MAIKISSTTVIDNSRNITNAVAGTFSGTVTADAFVGDGAQLTNLPATEFPSGTTMVFRSATAPPGWTKNTQFNNNALRVITGNSVGSGGSQNFTAVFGTPKSTSGHTLTTPEIPVHNHAMAFNLFPTLKTQAMPSGQFQLIFPTAPSTNTGNAGGGGSHSHGLSLNLKYTDVIIAAKD